MPSELNIRVNLQGTREVLRNMSLSSLEFTVKAHFIVKAEKHVLEHVLEFLAYGYKNQHVKASILFTISTGNESH